MVSNVEKVGERLVQVCDKLDVVEAKYSALKEQLPLTTADVDKHRKLSENANDAEVKESEFRMSASYGMLSAQVNSKLVSTHEQLLLLVDERNFLIDLYDTMG